MAEAPLVSVIALFDRGEFEPCLSSLLAQEGVTSEIIAVVSNPETQPPNQLPADRLKILPVENRNPAFRRNLAASHARGKFLAFIDDDATAPPGWLKRGVEYLENNPIYAGVGGPNLCPDNSSPRELLTDLVLTTPLIGAGSRAYRGGGRLQPAKPGEIHLVNFIARKDWFDRVNGLNEALGYGGEDTEFIYQAQKLGGKFMFDPELIVHHRRRPFGLPYFRQRFHLRRQSARLFVAYPGIYSQNPIFFVALLTLPVLVLLAAFINPKYFAALILATIMISPQIAYFLSSSPIKKMRYFRTPGYFVLSFYLHWLVNLAGLWWGLLEAIFTGPWRVRKRIRRTIASCGI